MKETITVEFLTQALKQLRSGDWLALAGSPLAASALVADNLLQGEPPTDAALARAVSALLGWTVGALRPGSVQSWHDNAWRHYNLLYYYYSEGWLAADVAEALAIAEQTFYEWRAAAIEAALTVIQREAAAPRRLAERQAAALQLRYQSADAAAQRLARLLTLVDALPIGWLPAFAFDDPNAALQTLHTLYALTYSADRQRVQLRPPFADWLRPRLAPNERIEWQRMLAHQCWAEGDFVAAARLHLQAGDWRAAAQQLIDAEATLFERRQVRELHALLTEFSVQQFTDAPNLWAKIKLIAGRSAEFLEDYESAIREYGLALRAPDLLTKAQAYYRRAKAYQRTNLDECLSHYAVCISLIQRQQAQPGGDLGRLLTRMYIDRAWIFIEERPDLALAQRDLQRAADVIPAQDSLLWTDLYNGRAALLYRRQQPQQALEQRLQAWVSAQESQQPQLMLKTAFNLGTDYVWSGQYARGIDYLERCMQLAEETGNPSMIATAAKGIGNAHAFMGEHQQAVERYQHAYALYKQTKNHNYLASTCHDLAEAYAELEAWTEARRYLTEAQQLAEQLGHTRYQQVIQTLIERYPRLVTELNERQQQAVAYLHAHGKLSRSDYITLTGLSKSQAHRDLEELCRQNIVQRVGKGRATRYELA